MIINVCSKCFKNYEIHRDNPLDAEFRELYWCPDCNHTNDMIRAPFMKIRAERTKDAVLDELVKIEKAGKRASLVIMGTDFFMQFAKGNDEFFMGRTLHGVPIFVVNTIDGFAVF